MDRDLTEKAVAPRHDGMAPKAIARALGTSVTDVITALNDAAPTDSGDEPQCWVSAGWSFGLGIGRRAGLGRR